MDFAPSRSRDRAPRARPRVHGGARRSRSSARRRGARRARSRPGVAYPRDPRRAARARQGRGALEPVPARRELRPRPDQLGVRDALRADGPQRVAPMVFNCSAPDTGNMEILAEHGTRRAEGALARSRCSTARSARCFSMTEPDTAGSDPTAAGRRAPSSTATSGSSTGTSGSPRATTARRSRSRWSSPTPTRRRTSAPA